jgi:hypothetical protein
LDFVTEELWTFIVVMLSCFFIFLIFLSYDLHICLNEYVLWFYSLVFLVSSLLLRAQSPVPLRWEKTNHFNSNNTAQAGAVCRLRIGLVKG